MIYLSWFQKWMLKRILNILIRNSQLTSLFKEIIKKEEQINYEDNTSTVRYCIEIHLDNAFRQLNYPPTVRK